ncbi:MAG: sirohydrochlorin chelatase [Cyanobacteria bacterium J06621_11]
MNHLSGMVRRRLARRGVAKAVSQGTPYMHGVSSSGGHLHDAVYGRERTYRRTLKVELEGSDPCGVDGDADTYGSLLTKQSVLTGEMPSELPLDNSLVASHRVRDDSVIVETACLELAVEPLHVQIHQFGLRLISMGVKELKLVPIFLMAGMHVMEDIPSEVAIARSLLGDAITLTTCKHLGSHSGMPSILTSRLASIPTEGSLLVAHGSRRAKGNKSIQSLAQKIGTPVAYWAVPPDIESQAITLMQQGCQGITILPYFLFAGGITDAIAHRTEELAERFPRVTFRLLPTLGATEEIADLVIDLVERQAESAESLEASQ